MKLIYNITLVIVFFALPTLSHAYVGPGTGLSALGSVVAFIGTIFLFIIGFIWYPIKRFIKSKKGDPSEEIPQETRQNNTQAKSSIDENK